MTNGEYQNLSEYNGNQTHVSILHTKCGNIYQVSPANFKSGYRCPFCSKRPKVDHNEFIKKVKELYGDGYSVIGSYIKNTSKILVRHNLCENEYYTLPRNFLQGYGCPECGGTKKLDIDTVKESISKISQNEYECISNSYQNNRTHLEILHKKCEKVYKARFDNFKEGFRCPHCSDIQNSKGVKIIKDFFESNNINYSIEKTFDDCINSETNRKLRFDFYLEGIDGEQVLIEFDGQQHFVTSKFSDATSLAKRKILDDIKDEYCRKNGKTLIRFNYTQVKNLKKILNETFEIS
jgi:hypothetical protein